MMNNVEQKRLTNREPAQGTTGRSAPSTPLKAAEKQTLPRPDSLNSLPKIPSGNSPYVKAKHVQLVDKDPNRAISLFWAAINSGDRVNSALKDMAIVMKQVGRAEEAVEAIKSFRYMCSADAQESLDNVLLDLYKRCGRMDEQIELLEHKLKLIEEGLVFGGKRTKIARSQGKKFHLSIDQERSRLLGNLAWAHLQKGKFQTAEALYRKALSIAPDKNKQCNLAICLMQTGRISEAKSLLARIQLSTANIDQNGPESYMKSFEVASEVLAGLESQLMQTGVETHVEEPPETDIERSSLSSTSNVSLNSKGTSNRNQKHGAAISQGLIKTGIESSSISALDAILNYPTPGSGNQGEGHQWDDENNAIELRSQDYMCRNMRHGNDVEGETTSSAPLTMGNLTSEVSNDQNHDHGSQILVTGQRSWQNDSAKELLASDEKANYYKMSSAISTLNNASSNVGASGNEAQIDAEAYAWVLDNGIEEEEFTYRNLNSNLAGSFPMMKWTGDSAPVPLRGNLRGPIQVPTIMNSQFAINPNWKGRDNAFYVPTQRSLKYPSQVLSSGQSPIREGELRCRADHLPVSVSSGEDKNTDRCRQPQAILIGNPQGRTPLHKLSMSASSRQEDSNCGSVISVSSKEVDCTNEKWSLKFGDLDPSVRIGSPAINNQKTVAHKNQADGSPVSNKGLADQVGAHTKAAHKFSAFNCGKTWAEMVEEEEEALAISNLNLKEDVKQTNIMSKESLGWNEKDRFPDENLNFNIVQNSPCQAVWSPVMQTTPPQKYQTLHQGYTNSLQWKPETPTFNSPSKQRKNPFSTGREQKSSARRCLSFEPEQKSDSPSDHSPALTKEFSVDDYSYLKAIGSGSKRRGNRLRVFQEITLSDSPRA